MSLYQDVTSRIVSALENSELPPWRCPWGDSPLLWPVNAKTNKPYSGINVLLLMMQQHPFSQWATKKAWLSLGAKVLPDQRPIEIVFFQFFEKEEKRIPFMRIHEVFNLYQVKGANELRKKHKFAGEFKPADKIIKASKARIVYGGSVAQYDVTNDCIACPSRNFFQSPAGFYTTVFHELAHWTGKRLGRKYGERKSLLYAQEELVAELCSCFVSAALDIPEAYNEMPNHISYVKEWIKIMQQDERAVFAAASAAQKAANYLLAFQKKRCKIS